MEIKSEPKYLEEPVIDVDAGFISGEVRQFTLKTKRGDSIKPLTDRVELILHDQGQEPENLTLYKKALAWLSTRHRILRTPVPGRTPAPLPETLIQAEGDEPASTESES